MFTIPFPVWFLFCFVFFTDIRGLTSASQLEQLNKRYWYICQDFTEYKYTHQPNRFPDLMMCLPEIRYIAGNILGPGFQPFLASPNLWRGWDKQGSQDVHSRPVTSCGRSCYSNSRIGSLCFRLEKKYWYSTEYHMKLSISASCPELFTLR